jgi:ABC-type Zn uptake system ZnuABC Zn-binding protein ZnuA
MAVESFLADIAQNVIGKRLSVDTLIPLGMDTHTFEPTPADLTHISDCQLLIVNGAGMENWLNKNIENAGRHCQVVEASAGLVSRSTSGTNQSTSADLNISSGAAIVLTATFFFFLAYLFAPQRGLLWIKLPTLSH